MLLVGDCSDKLVALAEVTASLMFEKVKFSWHGSWIQVLCGVTVNMHLDFWSLNFGGKLLEIKHSEYVNTLKFTSTVERILHLLLKRWIKIVFSLTYNFSHIYMQVLTCRVSKY